MFLFTELGNIVLVIVTTPMFILPWVGEKFTIKFTIDGYTIYMYTGCLSPEKPQIDQHPAEYPEIVDGKDVEFTITATVTGDDKNLIYQWQKDNKDIPGATECTYRINKVDKSHEGNYRCLVSSPPRCNCIKSNTTSKSTRLRVSELCLFQPFWELSLQCINLAIHAVMQTCVCLHMCACVCVSMCVCVCAPKMSSIAYVTSVSKIHSSHAYTSVIHSKI